MLNIKDSIVSARHNQLTVSSTSRGRDWNKNDIIQMSTGFSGEDVPHQINTVHQAIEDEVERIMNQKGVSPSKRRRNKAHPPAPASEGDGLPRWRGLGDRKAPNTK